MEIQSVGEIICSEIRRRILEGFYPSGARLNADDLARTLETSKTPVREALGRLENEGLVVFKPRVGWSVSALTVEEFVDFLEIQCALRFFISDNLSPYIDKLDFGRLEALNKEMRQRLDGQNYFRIIQQNDLFHMEIFSVHPNKAMLRRLNELDGLIRLQRVRFFEQERAYSPSIAENAYTQHQSILEKLKSRDADAISQVSRDHFASIVAAYQHLSQNIRKESA
jgi:DNA-binding GntR family transcriptional regulator